MKLRAAFYDMDGLLLDSEPYWVQAEAEVLDDVISAQKEAEKHGTLHAGGRALGSARCG